MNTLWLFLNVFFAATMYHAANDELYEKSKFVWLLFLFFSAWNGASVAVALS